MWGKEGSGGGNGKVLEEGSSGENGGSRENGTVLWDASRGKGKVLGKRGPESIFSLSLLILS